MSKLLTQRAWIPCRPTFEPGAVLERRQYGVCFSWQHLCSKQAVFHFLTDASLDGLMQHLPEAKVIMLPVAIYFPVEALEDVASCALGFWLLKSS